FHSTRALDGQAPIWNNSFPDEFAEFAAMSLWYLALPFLGRDEGGCYSAEELVRLREEYVTIEGVQANTLVDAFQHWVYGEAPDDVTPADLDAKWVELSARFEPWWDWSGLEDYQAAGWQRSWSLYQQPFYEISYAIAQLGALQIWQRAQTDPADA